jgi:quercetin dioxygenase-like cupin family protein
VKHPSATDETQARAALHALGALSAQEAREFERHLDDGCAVCAAEWDAFAAVAAGLAIAPAPVSPAPSVRSRLLEEARGARRAGPAAGFYFMRERDAAWVDLGPGISRQVLAGRPGTPPATYLVRLAAGATVDTHTHDGVEHCYVLAGDLLVAGEHLVAGDYHEAPASSVHQSLRSEAGCLLLIVESRP